MQPIPKPNATPGRDSGREFERQWPVAGARHVLPELFLVRREDADAAPTARDGHIPLLRTRGRLDGRGVIAQIARSTRRAIARTQASSKPEAKRSGFDEGHHPFARFALSPEGANWELAFLCFDRFRQAVF